MDPFGSFGGMTPGGRPMAPRPTTETGDGQMFTIATAPGAAATLPAGGQWLWWAFGSVLATGAVQTMPAMSISPGGTVIRPATLTVSWCGWAWRIS